MTPHLTASIAVDAPATLQHSDIALRIPHQGRMCLLERVSRWSEAGIWCEAVSHQASDNPLRAHGRLGAACGIEYAAQAMAIHGALMAEIDAHPGTPRPAPKAGYLVSLRGVDLRVERLDNLPGPLSIHAERLSADARTILYSFTLHHALALVLSGRAIVVLDAVSLAPAIHADALLRPAQKDHEHSPRIEARPGHRR